MCKKFESILLLKNSGRRYIFKVEKTRFEIIALIASRCLEKTVVITLARINIFSLFSKMTTVTPFDC